MGRLEFRSIQRPRFQFACAKFDLGHPSLLLVLGCAISVPAAHLSRCPAEPGGEEIPQQ